MVAKLASSISQNDVSGAMGLFDSGAKQYGVIEANLTALLAQADVLCAIDVIEDKAKNGVETLDVDWYMQLKSHAESGPDERRRQRVLIEVRDLRGKWKIISLRPIEILDPIHIQ